jgi:signal transduction histidine kinase
MLGLSGMEERAALAGGHVEIETAVGAGTTVYLRLPLAREPAQWSAATDE